MPLLSTSTGDATTAGMTNKDEFTPLTKSSSSKYTPNQQRLMRVGEIWRSYIAPATLVFVLVLPMVIYNKDCKFFSFMNQSYILRYIYTHSHLTCLFRLHHQTSPFFMIRGMSL